MTEKAEADVNWDELRPQIIKLALELGHATGGVGPDQRAPGLGLAPRAPGSR